jgi:hypothetical protein
MKSLRRSAAARLVTVNLLLCILALGCASSKQSAPNAEAAGSNASGAAQATATTKCTVIGQYGPTDYKAKIRGNKSKARHGLLNTTARLEGDTVIYKHGLMNLNAGRVDEPFARFAMWPRKFTSDPIVDGKTILPMGPFPLHISSEGCTTRQVAFGTLHLAAIIFAQRANNAG